MITRAELLSFFRAQVLPSIRIALEAVARNKLRAGLTSLGILFGVASVIAMLAVGRGAEQEIVEQMRLLGTNNFVIQPALEQEEGEAGEEREQRRYSPGLTVRDAQSIATVLPRVDGVSGELVLQTLITREGHRRSGKLVGIDTTYFRMLNLTLAQGRTFTAAEIAGSAPVAVIGHGVRARFFTTEEPLGRRIKVGDTWLTVVGILADRQVTSETAGRLGIRDANMDVYVPLTTALLRYRNRAQVTGADIQRAARQVRITNEENNVDETVRAERSNRHQLDRIIVRVDDPAAVAAVAAVARRMLARRHNDVIDFEIAVPELLLKQEQRTKTIFNIVLSAIASISLLVGGIGIMNIMLASVLERIREIGVRRALGATQRNILGQFLAEASMISLGGGIAGILLGVGFSIAIEQLAGIRTLVSAASIAVAFAVSMTVGLVFGIVPAWRASRQDPVVSLRYE
jgi:putative ABC transport system permease protein